MGRTLVGLVVVSALTLTVAPTQAQDFCLNEADLALAMSTEREIQASVGLQVLSALLASGGAAAIPLGANTLISGPPAHEETGLTWFVGGIVIVSLAAIALGFGIALEVDGISRGA